MLGRKMNQKVEKEYIAPARSVIQAAMKEAEIRREEAGLLINGKKYLSVKDRVDIFRKFFGFDLSIITEVVSPDHMASKGSPVKAICFIKDTNSGALLATGTAMEYIGSSEYTRTSPFEVAETSAIGRALAALGLHGGEYASSNEVAVAKASKTLPSIGKAPKADTSNKSYYDLLAEVTDMTSLVEAAQHIRDELDKNDATQDDREAINELLKARLAELRGEAVKQQEHSNGD